MRRRDSDDGLGLTEVMVAMLILAILFMALIALLIRGLTTVADNSTRASAYQLATARVEEARQVAVTGDCTSVRAIVEASETVEDGRGVRLNVSGALADCTQVQDGNVHDEPKLAKVTVTVTTTTPGYDNPVAKTSSNVYVNFDAS